MIAAELQLFNSEAATFIHSLNTLLEHFKVAHLKQIYRVLDYYV